MTTMVVRFPRSDDFDEAEDEALRQELEAWCSEALRAGGLGTCEECAIEEVHVSAWCRVTDAQRACDAVVSALLAHGLDGMHVGVIPHAPEPPTVLWPEGARGHFLEL